MTILKAIKTPVSLNFRAISLFLFITGSISCSVDPGITPDPSLSRIEIQNEEDFLNQQVTTLEDTISVIEQSTHNRKVKKVKFSLILKNEIAPPEINGHKLQASSVYLDKNQAVVSYNFIGSPYYGAIESFTVNRRAKMKSRILFKDADIHDVFIYDKKVYLATGSSNTIDDQTAIAEVYSVRGFKFETTDYKRFALGSFAVNSVNVFDETILYTTGDDEMNGGGIYQVDLKNYALLNYTALHDARWADTNNTDIFVMQGTPGRYSRLDRQFRLLDQIPVEGADIPESKSTIEVHGNMVFIAAGSAGVQIFDINRNIKIGEIPLPGSKPGQIMLTNAVSYDDGLLFISNGEGGIWVAEVITPVTSKFDKVNLTLLGYLEFDNLPSVNHVSFRNNLLFIASGSAGVKVVQVIR